MLKPKKEKDDELLEGLYKRDNRILKRIYKQFFPGVLNFVKKNSGNHADAEDVFQEGLIIMYRKVKAGDFELTSSFYTFFYAVCKKVWLKKMKKRSTKEVSFGVQTELKEDASINKTLEQSEQYELYQSKFKLLGADCQRLLQMFFEKKSMEEIMGVMGFGSIGYTKKRKFKCKEKLITLIKQDARYQELIS